MSSTTSGDAAATTVSTGINGNSRAPTSALALAPVAIILGALLFNPLLAFVNANVTAIGSKPVIACEIALVGAAHALALSRYKPEMAIWYVYAVFIGVFTVFRMYATGTFEIKYFRDLAMLPTFVVLGMAATERQAINAMLLAVGAVTVGILLEALSLDTFVALFDVKSYYINTRGVSPDEFTNESSNLYISATRPEARFFPFFDLHRLSSIFLEPVSLGNFLIIAAAFACAFWTRLSARERTFMVAAIVLMQFACDGRLSSAAILIVLSLAAVSRLLPRNFALLLLPIVIATVSAVVIGLDLESETDDLPGRLTYTHNVLASLDLADYMGASDRLLSRAQDSGIAYLIITQSLVGVVLMWAMIVLGLPETDDCSQRYKNGVCTYLALSMMVSFAIVTIKTAAPMWFVYGMLAGRRLPEAEEARTADHDKAMRKTAT